MQAYRKDTILSIIGVSGHFVSLPTGFAGSLTAVTVTIFLILNSRIGNKAAAAMHTAKFQFHGLPPMETINRLPAG
jgi:hypothetical protein